MRCASLFSMLMIVFVFGCGRKLSDRSYEQFTKFDKTAKNLLFVSTGPGNLKETDGFLAKINLSTGQAPQYSKEAIDKFNTFYAREDLPYLWVLNQGVKKANSIQVFDRNLKMLPAADPAELREMEPGSKETDPFFQQIWIRNLSEAFLTRQTSSWVVRFNPVTLKKTGVIDLSKYKDVDGSPEPFAMVSQGDELAISLQRIHRQGLVFTFIEKSAVVFADLNTLKVQNEMLTDAKNLFTNLSVHQGNLWLGGAGSLDSSKMEWADKNGLVSMSLSGTRSSKIALSAGKLGVLPAQVEPANESLFVAGYKDKSFGSRLVEYVARSNVIDNILEVEGASGEIRALKFDPTRQLLFVAVAGKQPKIMCFDARKRVWLQEILLRQNPTHLELLGGE